MVTLTIKMHEKKHKNLIKKLSVTLYINRHLLNLSSIKLTEEKLGILKYGLKHLTEPRLIKLMC